MKRDKFESLTSIVSRNLINNPVSARLSRQTQLLRHVKTALGPTISAHCLGASITDSTLTVTLDSPTWATRLHLQQQHVVTIIQEKENQTIHDIKTRVRQTPKISIEDISQDNHEPSVATTHLDEIKRKLNR